MDDPTSNSSDPNDTQPTGDSAGVGSTGGTLQPVDDPQGGMLADAPWENSKERPPLAMDADMLAGVPPASLDTLSNESPLTTEDDSDSAS